MSTLSVSKDGILCRSVFFSAPLTCSSSEGPGVTVRRDCDDVTGDGDPRRVAELLRVTDGGRGSDSDDTCCDVCVYKYHANK